MQFFRVLWWRLRYALWYLQWRVMFWSAEWRTVHGIKVGVFGVWEDQVLKRAFEKIDTALGLIAIHEPRRLQRATRDMRRLWIRRAAYSSAYYLQTWQMCVIDLKFLTDDQTSAAKAAAVLVHEATHARLFNCGIRYTEKARLRIESICVAESASFSRRLPDGEALARHVEACQPSNESHWSDQNLDHRMLQARLQEMDEAPLASWLKRLLRRVLLSRAA